MYMADGLSRKPVDLHLCRVESLSYKILQSITFWVPLGRIHRVDKKQLSEDVKVLMSSCVLK